MNTNEHPLTSYLDVHQATRHLTNDVIWMSWPHHLHTSLKASRSFCMHCQHWLQVSNALCQEPCPVLNKRALQFLCWHKLQSVSNRYSARWLRLHQPALQEVLTRHSSSLFNFTVLDDLPLMFCFWASRSTGFQDRISLLHFLFKVVLLFSHSMRNFEPYHSLVPPQLSLASLSHFVPASWSCPASCPNGVR